MFARIVRQPVQLRAGRGDKFEGPFPHRHEGGPTEPPPGVFGNRAQPPHVPGLFAEQIAPVDLRSGRQPDAGKQGRHHVGQGCSFRADLASVLASRQTHDQRHAQRRLVKQHTVGLLAVFSQAFAVVRSQHDHRRLGHTETLEPRHQPSDLRIDEGHLAVVRPPRVPRPKIFGRLVGRMGIKEVQPQKERSGGPLPPILQPAKGPTHPLVGRRSGVHHLVERSVGSRTIVVVIEPAIEAERSVQNEGRHKSRAIVTNGREALRQSGRRRPCAHAVVDDAVVPGLDPGVQRPMRRQRQRYRGECILETDTPLRQRIEGRRLDGPGTIGTEPIGPQRVDRNEQHIGPGRRWSLATTGE